MSAYRLKDQRLFVPGVGTIPYIRHLQLLKMAGRHYFKVRGKLTTSHFGVYGQNYKEPLLLALEEIVKSYGALFTCRSLKTRESSNKKNPTGYVGVYSLEGNSTPYRVTCPYETNEPAYSLRTAGLIREQASEEYLRKNTFTVRQVLAQAAAY